MAAPPAGGVGGMDDVDDADDARTLLGLDGRLRFAGRADEGGCGRTLPLKKR